MSTAWTRLSAINGHLAQQQQAKQLTVNTVSGSEFTHVPLAPPDAIFVTKDLFVKDKDPKKINLGIGAYRTEEGKPFVLNVVRAAEKAIAANDKLDHEYLGIGGDDEYVKLARQLLFGTDSKAIKENRIATVQTISGTGALRVGAQFIASFMKGRTVYYSDPTWGNHLTIFQHAGVPIKPYRYWKNSTRGIDLDGFLEDLQKAADGSIILLHACAHNPTGVDPTVDQWKAIAKVMQQKKHFPFFDSAYQGFASGDLEKDAFSIRYFTELGFEMLAAQSFAKNFGLYGERTGSLSVVTKDAKITEAVFSQLEGVIRPMYSNPPAYGARIVKTVLSNPKLYDEWKQELVVMSQRIIKMRGLLFDHLKKLGTPGTWDHIVSQIGMFSYTGLSKKQCEVLRDQLHVYLLLNGRISMAGINTKNVEYLAKAIDEVVRKYP